VVNRVLFIELLRLPWCRHEVQCNPVGDVVSPKYKVFLLHLTLSKPQRKRTIKEEAVLGVQNSNK